MKKKYFQQIVCFPLFFMFLSPVVGAAEEAKIDRVQRLYGLEQFALECPITADSKNHIDLKLCLLGLKMGSLNYSYQKYIKDTFTQVHHALYQRAGEAVYIDIKQVGSSYNVMLKRKKQPHINMFGSFEQEDENLALLTINKDDLPHIGSVAFKNWTPSQVAQREALVLPALNLSFEVLSDDIRQRSLQLLVLKNIDLPLRLALYESCFLQRKHAQEEAYSPKRFCTKSTQEHIFFYLYTLYAQEVCFREIISFL